MTEVSNGRTYESLKSEIKIEKFERRNWFTSKRKYMKLGKISSSAEYRMDGQFQISRFLVFQIENFL